MADEGFNTTAESPEAVATSDNSTQTANDLLDPMATFIPGEFTPFDYSSDEFFDFNAITNGDKVKNAIKEMVLIASRTDVASRRFEVEQAWEARLFERGYQHLLPRRGGGWSLPGEGSSWGPLSTADSSALYSTNIYGRDKDIIVAAMARETPQIQFFPGDPNNTVDIMAADGANKYKDIYEKNNNLREVLSQLGYFYYTEDRVILYTRLVLDKQKFGVEDDGSPRGREITTVHGKLEAKVPVPVNGQRDMQFVQIYDECDVARAKASFPWISKDIRPGSCGIGEIELDKIARVNTRLALLGSYVTGDSLMRDVTIQHTWFRPEMFYDPSITDDVRDVLLQNFPDGMLVVFAGQQLAFTRNENMDEHLVVTHAMPGIGQNRRALGSNNISIQKRLNSYMDIMDDFFRRTVPRRHYNADAFDVKALMSQDNIPGGSGPYQPQPGQPASELVFVEPTPQPQPSLPEFTKLFFEDFPASLCGALPSLFGASTNTDTVGGIAIQRDSALGRIGVPWNSAKEAITMAAHQAVIAAANRKSAIKDTSKDGTVVQIDPNVLKGNVVCYPEYDQSFPESWRERELRYTEIVTNAAQNPFYAELLKDTRNIRAIADNIRMADLFIPGEDSVKKALVEIEQLKMSAPLDNPQFLLASAQLEKIGDGMLADKMNGVPIPPEGSQMYSKAQEMVNAIPKQVPSIKVAQDKSENHEIEAQTCYVWLNGDEGQKFKTGTAEEQAGYQNVLLYWQAHSEMAEKLAPPPPPPPQRAPSISFKGEDLPPDVQTQALSQAGLQSTPQAQTTASTVATNHKIAQKIVPKGVPENIDIHKITRNANNKGQFNGPQQ